MAALQEAQQAKIRRRFTHDERAATTETNRRLLKEERERELRERAKEKVHSVRVAILGPSEVLSDLSNMAPLEHPLRRC